MNWETLMSWGDSITIGSRSYLSYPEYAAHLLEKHTMKSWNVVNHAVAGYTTIDLVRYVTQNFQNLQSHSPSLITIMIGTNDLKSNTPSEEFKIAYNLLVLKARLVVKNSNIILLKIPALGQGVMLPYTLSMNERINEYNKIIEEIASETGCMVKSFDTNSEDYLDGVHLNKVGAGKWGEQLSKMILDLRYS